MRKKKIKSVDLGSRQLSLDFEPSGEKDKAAILGCVEGPEADGRPIPIDDLIMRLTDKPYGLDARRAAQLLLELVADYKLVVEKNGERLRPPDAKKVLASSSRWKNTVIAPGEVASPDELKEAAALCRDIFDPVVNGGQDEFNRFLRKRLRRWKNDLSSFRRTADRGVWPGRQEIETGLALIHLLLAVEDPRAFIRTVVENKSELTRVGGDVDVLTDFYKNKRELWNTLLKALEEFEPNREELEKNPDAGKALGELRGISEASDPYDRLGDVEALIAAAAEKNREIAANKLDAARETAMESLENRIAALSRLLEERKVAPNQKNRALFRLQKIKKKLLALDDARQVESCLDDVEEAYDLAREFIDTLGGV